MPDNAIPSHAAKYRTERGPLERDPDIKPVLKLIRGVPFYEYAYRRKVTELWRDENGRQMGRWHWEYV